MRLDLGAYQIIEFEQVNLGEQYTEGGRKPRTLRARLTTAMDEHFVNKTTTVLLTEQAQRSIIQVLEGNLAGNAFNEE